MSKIQFSVNNRSLSVAQSRGAKINAIKMEIAQVKNEAKMGLISQDEAQMKIATLESKLNEVEFGPSSEITPEIAPAMTPQGETPKFNSDNFAQNESSNFIQQQDAFFQQQASYNRAFHNI